MLRQEQAAAGRLVADGGHRLGRRALGGGDQGRELGRGGLRVLGPAAGLADVDEADRPLLDAGRALGLRVELQEKALLLGAGHQQRLAQRRLETKIEGMRRKRDAEVDAVERRLGAAVRREQDRQKWLAVLLPPIPPLVVAFMVFFRRRAKEREGVAKTRLR